MGRTTLPASAEAKRQASDRNRRLHSQAYRFILNTQRQSGSVPSTLQLAAWLKEQGKLQARPGKLIADMIKTGWLLPHFEGYRLRTQTSLESIIEALILAHNERNNAVFDTLVTIYRDDQGRATAKTGRKHR